MSRRKLVWICALTWALAANGVALCLIADRNEGGIRSLAHGYALSLSRVLPGSRMQLELACELGFVISAAVGVLAIPIAVAAGAALLGAIVTRYPAK